MISTIKLSDPLWIGNYCVDLVEIPQPNGKYQFGWEHLELVVDCRDRYKKIKLNDFNIKFHFQSLENVIHIENNVKLFKIANLIESEFKECLPIISGTMPLDLNTQNSDADILFYSDNFNLLADKLNKKFSGFSNYSVKDSETREGPCLLCRFNFDGLDIEIFAQEIDPLQQHAHQHFLVENRLIKIFGNEFKQRVLSRKEVGEKTEPAFAAELGLSIEADAYLDLLDMRTVTDRGLYNKYSEYVFRKIK